MTCVKLHTLCGPYNLHYRLALWLFLLVSWLFCIIDNKPLLIMV